MAGIGSYLVRVSSAFTPKGLHSAAQVIDDNYFSPRQIFGDGYVKVAASLFAAVSFFGRRVPTNLDVGEVVLDVLVDVFDHGIVQGLLVAFERQYKVRFLIDDLRGDRFLRPHRVDGDDGALDVHEPQKLGDCRDSFDFSAQAT